MKEFCTRELSTFAYTAYLKDCDGTPIPLDAIDTIKLTLYNAKDGTKINGRDQQDVKNANGVTIHPTSGLLTFRGSPADSPVFDDCVVREVHIALFEWTYNNSDGGQHQVAFLVENN